MRRERALWLGFFFVAATFLAGCDASMADVKGTVKYDGKLIEEGSIRFEPVDGKSKTTGDIIKGGQYAAKVPIGEMKVTISAAKVVGPKKLYDTPNSPTMDLKAEALPDKYSDFQKTELKFDVKAGANTKDWDLSK